MISRRHVVWVLALVMWLPVLAEAAGPAAGPLKQLQEQVDLLTQQYAALATRLTPPTLTHELKCVYSEGTIELTITAAANKEIVYYAAQEQSDKGVANFVVFVDPGFTTITRGVTVDLGGYPRKILLVGGDTDGNVARALVDVPANPCD